MNSRFLKASKALRDRLTGKPRQLARAKKRQHRLLFESLEDRRLLAASPPLLSTIEGFDIDANAFNTGATYLAPPDPYGAAGRNHVVNVGNLSIQWFTKAGIQQQHTSLNNFFAPLRPLTYSNTTDPKVIYDQYSDRFVVMMLEFMDGTTPLQTVDMSRILMAVSDDGDPNGTWYYQSINSMVNVPDPTTAAFRLKSPTEMCGKCHSDPQRMSKYNISTSVLNTYVAD